MADSYSLWELYLRWWKCFAASLFQTAPPCFQGLLRIDRYTAFAAAFSFDTLLFMNKDEIRQQALKARARIPDNPDAEAALYKRFFDAFPLDDLKDKVVALYWPMGHELDCSYLIEKCLSEKITICLPVVEENSKVLSFYQWDQSKKIIDGGHKTKEPQRLEGEEPVIPDVVVHPIVAFDRYGTRLGRGGGYYDATIADLRQKHPSVICIGLAFDTQLCLFPLPKEDHDQMPDMILTPTQTYKFA